MTRPHLWYSSARSMSRRFIYHAGPTNSGKTFSALQVRLFCLTSRRHHMLSTAESADIVSSLTLLHPYSYLHGLCASYGSSWRIGRST